MHNNAFYLKNKSLLLTSQVKIHVKITVTNSTTID